MSGKLHKIIRGQFKAMMGGIPASAQKAQYRKFKKEALKLNKLNK